MKFGVREICDVCLRAKAPIKIGSKKFYKNEPVIYFDSLKTSSMEGAATTVYAQGGKGNSRLIAWEGERTVTFTMEDALISPAGFMILSGAGLVEAGVQDENGNVQKIIQHVTETVKVNEDGVILLSEEPYDPQDGDNYIYVMTMSNDTITSEPFIYVYSSESHEEGSKYAITLSTAEGYRANPDLTPSKNDIVFVDYYTAREGKGAQQIEITADKFGGNYYLEASTLFRDTNGVDMPAEFIIPNCKIQSNFTFTMASSGDPSTFTFTMDAFPDTTRFDKTKKVLAAIQIINEVDDDDADSSRTATQHDYTV